MFSTSIMINEAAMIIDQQCWDLDIKYEIYEILRGCVDIPNW